VGYYDLCSADICILFALLVGVYARKNPPSNNRHSQLHDPHKADHVRRRKSKHLPWIWRASAAASGSGAFLRCRRSGSDASPSSQGWYSPQTGGNCCHRSQPLLSTSHAVQSRRSSCPICKPNAIRLFAEHALLIVLGLLDLSAAEIFGLLFKI
jgi:hypothetical protein